MLTFLPGRPGSGKTAYMIDAIKESVAKGKKTYFLVPEQNTFISECMLADLPASAARYFEVVSFSRLCEIAFSEYGGLTDSSAGSGIRNLLMWQNLRQLSGLLKEYGKTSPDRTFTQLMLSMVDELKASSFTPSFCEEVCQKIRDAEMTTHGNELADKMSDITLVYANFERLLDERLGHSVIHAENKLQRLAELLDEHKDCFSKCSFYVDSFVSFTGEERAVLEQLMCRAKDFCISFCIDFKKKESYTNCKSFLKKDIHTESIYLTMCRFWNFAEGKKLEPKIATQLTENKRTRSQSLRMIEEHLWDFSLKPETVWEKIKEIPPEAFKDIDMLICRNEYEEAYFAALEIRKAKQSGMNYSEMALIMHDCESRKGIIDAVFEDAGIPYFYSEKTDLSATAPSRLLLSALRCIAFNFRTSDVLTLLKTDLCGIDLHDADLFEDYCTVWNIEGSKFTDKKMPWSMNPDGYTIKERTARGNEILSAANRVKIALITPLLTLRQNLKLADGNAVASCRALYDYLEEIRLSETLSEKAKDALAVGELREAGEILRIYDFIIEALTEIATVMAEDRLSPEELADALEIILSNTDIGSVPAVGDYVTVGSAATLRVENIKMAIVMGLCEGEFPKGYSDAGLLTETDKQKLAEVSFELDSRESRITSDELFHVYRAMTRPSEKLILSTITSHINGGTLTPSSAWNRVSYLFKKPIKINGKTEYIDLIKPKKLSLAHVRALAESMAEKGEDSKPVIEGDLKITDTPVDKEVVEIDPRYVRLNVFGDKLRLSKSGITEFVECPYKYWCDYVLDLREIVPATVSYSDSGTIIHYVLENFVKERMIAAENIGKKGQLLPLAPTELIRDVDRILGDYIKNVSCPLPPYMMYSFSRIRDLSLVMAKSVLDEFQASNMRVLALEKSISDYKTKDNPRPLSPMEIRVRKSDPLPIVSLGGVIDRIDRLDTDSESYLRIIDYKTGNKKFDISKVASGADLQLPAYLFTAAQEENMGLLNFKSPPYPASALYLSAGEEAGKINPIRSGFLLAEKEYIYGASKENDRKLLAGAYYKKPTKKDSEPELHAGKSAISRAEINKIKETLCNTIAKTADNMYSGKVPRTPSEDACTYCRMKASCPVAHKSKK